MNSSVLVGGPVFIDANRASLARIMFAAQVGICRRTSMRVFSNINNSHRIRNVVSNNIGGTHL